MDWKEMEEDYLGLGLFLVITTVVILSFIISGIWLMIKFNPLENPESNIPTSLPACLVGEPVSNPYGVKICECWGVIDNDICRDVK